MSEYTPARLEFPISKIDNEIRCAFGWANVPVPGKLSQNVKKSVEGSVEERLDKIQSAYRAQYGAGNDQTWSWIVATFDSSVIVQWNDERGVRYFQHAYVMDGDSVAFGEPVEVEQVYVEKQLAASRVRVDALDEKVVQALGKTLLADLIANARSGRYKTDSQDDIVPLEELELTAYAFNLESRVGGADHEKAVGRLVESFFATPEKYERMGVPAEVAKDLNAGWWLGFKIDDDETWDRVKKGELSMFSIGGFASATEVS